MMPDLVNRLNAPPTRVIVGASSQDYPGWIQTQQSELDITVFSDWTALFAPASLTHILAEHVWEHLTTDEGVLAARNAFQMLAPGGRLRCAVPDGLFPDEAYQRTVQVGGPGPSDHPASDHKVVYTDKTLTALFCAAGFAVVLLEWWDAEGTFHAEPWDEHDGFVYRSLRFDHRNQGGSLGFTSLIVDAIRPAER